MDDSDKMLDRILALFDASSKSDMELEREIGLPRSIIYDWRNKRSKSYKKYIVEISKYFGVPVSALYGVEMTPKLTFENEKLTKKISSLINIMESLKALQYHYNGSKAAFKRAEMEIAQINSELKEFPNSSDDNFNSQYYALRENAENRLEKVSAEYRRAAKDLEEIENHIAMVLRKDSSRVENLYSSLDDVGKQKALDYMDDLIASGKYAKK